MKKLSCDPEGVVLRLREMIELHGGTAAAATATGVPVKRLNHYTQGEALPGLLTIACICRGLGVSADWLLFGETE